MTLSQDRERLVIFLIIGRLHLIAFPAHIKDSFTACRELRIIALSCYFDRFILMCRSRSTNQLSCNKNEDILFSCRKPVKVSGGNTACGDNCVVSRDFLVVDNFTQIGSMHHIETEVCIAESQHIKRRLFHIVRKIPAVRSGICDQLLFVQILRVVKCLLCGVAVDFVRFTL